MSSINSIINSVIIINIICYYNYYCRTSRCAGPEEQKPRKTDAMHSDERLKHNKS